MCISDLNMCNVGMNYILRGGNSFMRVLVYGLLTYKYDDQKVLDFAMSASCLKQLIYCDMNLITVSEVDYFMKGDASGRVRR